MSLSYAVVNILNTSDENKHVQIMLYFTDKDRYGLARKKSQSLAIRSNRGLRRNRYRLFDFGIKDYQKTTFKEQMEVLVLTGDISMYNDKYKIYAHVVLGRKDGTVHRGHLMKGFVHPTLEIILNESPEYLKREMDKDSEILLIKI